MDATLSGGFADPVLQSQATFRAIMDALANPGSIHPLVVSGSISGNLSPELGNVLLALTDHDCGIWLDDVLANDRAVLNFIAFHAGAAVSADRSISSFAFVSGLDHLPRLETFNLGSQEYPDRSTTVVLAVPALSGGPAMVLRGPGVDGERQSSPQGLPGDFIEQWSANRALFPRGVDLLLVADGQVMGMPRSTRIAEGQ